MASRRFSTLASPHFSPFLLSLSLSLRHPRSFAPPLLSGNPYNPIVVKGDNSLKSGFGLLGQEHPAYNGDAEEGPWVHFYVGAWTQGGHQMVGARIELNEWVHVAATYSGTEIKLFINGSMKASIDWATTEEEAELMHTKGNLMSASATASATVPIHPPAIPRGHLMTIHSLCSTLCAPSGGLHSQVVDRLTKLYPHS